MIISFQFYENKYKKEDIFSSATLAGDTFENYFKRFGFIHDDFFQKVLN